MRDCVQYDGMVTVLRDNVHPHVCIRQDAYQKGRVKKKKQQQQQQQQIMIIACDNRLKITLRDE